MDNPPAIPLALAARLRDAAQHAGHIVVLTGAGISAESGVPTFRDALTGLWARYDPMQLATPQAFQRRPELVWDWYAWRRQVVAEVAPNAGHLALAEMERRAPRFTLITQNVDSLHQRAGNRAVIELHGNLSRVKCSREGQVVAQWPATDERPPPCPTCGAPLRPDVVWFGEAASLPLLAVDAGALAVEINPEETPLSASMHYTLRGPSGVVLPALVAAVWPDV